MRYFRECVLCGKEGRKFYTAMKDCRYRVEGSFDFSYCPSCDFLWMNPMPTPEETRKFYEDYFTHDVRSYPKAFDGNSIVRSVKNFIHTRVLCGHYGYRNAHKRHILCWVGHIAWFMPFVGRSAVYHLGPLLPRFDKIKGSTVIDVGCGDGEYIEMLRDIGCDVLGVEPDPQACVVLKKKNIPFVESSIEDARLAENSANLITMRHVIEHLTDPLRTVNECFRVLKPGGVLVVRTPNSASLSHRYFKNAWYPIDTPRHLFLFSPKSMKLFAGKSLFNECHIKTLAATAENIYDTSLMILKKGDVRSTTVKPGRGRLWFGLKERMLCALGFDVGEEIEAVFTKK